MREVLGGSDRGYDLPEGIPKELEMSIGCAKIGSGEVVEEEVLNGIFTVPYPYVMAEEVAARPQLKRIRWRLRMVQGWCEVGRWFAWGVSGRLSYG